MPRIEDIIGAEQKRIESVLRAAFEAGEEHAKSNMLALLSGETTKSGSSAQQGESLSERKRAPRGLPRKLVKRVLEDNSFLGTTPQDIEDAAVTEEEQMIALSTIRSELRKGKDEGLYYEEDGHWYLGRNPLDKSDDLDDII